MHNEAPQKGAEALEILAVQLNDFGVARLVMIGMMKMLTGRDPVIYGIKAGGDP